MRPQKCARHPVSHSPTHPHTHRHNAEAFRGTMRRHSLLLALAAAAALALPPLSHAQFAGPGPNIKVPLVRDKPNVLDVEQPVPTPPPAQPLGTPGLPFGLSPAAASARGNIVAAAQKARQDASTAVATMRQGAATAADKVREGAEKAHDAAERAADAVKPPPLPTADPAGAFLVPDPDAADGHGAKAHSSRPARKQDPRAAIGVWLGIAIAGTCLVAGLTAAAVAVGFAVKLRRRREERLVSDEVEAGVGEGAGEKVGTEAAAASSSAAPPPPSNKRWSLSPSRLRQEGV